MLRRRAARRIARELGPNRTSSAKSKSSRTFWPSGKSTRDSPESINSIANVKHRSLRACSSISIASTVCVAAKESVNELTFSIGRALCSIQRSHPIVGTPAIAENQQALASQSSGSVFDKGNCSTMRVATVTVCGWLDANCFDSRKLARRQATSFDRTELSESDGFR